MNFSEWIVEELERRGWSRSEAARRGKISPSMFDKVINGYAKPGVKFLDGIAIAFEISPVVVYRKAGLLPESGGEKINFADWEFMLEQLTPDERDEIFAIMDLKVKRRKESEQAERARNFKPKTFS